LPLRQVFKRAGAGFHFTARSAKSKALPRETSAEQFGSRTGSQTSRFAYKWTYANRLFNPSGVEFFFCFYHRLPPVATHLEPLQGLN
jgi:hypothetical protein